MAVANRGRRHNWTIREDNYLKFAAKEGYSFTAVGKFLGVSRDVAEQRHMKLLQEDQDARQKITPKAHRAIEYLQSRGYIVYETEEGYTVNSNHYTYLELLEKAKRVEENTKLLYGG